jgi:murein DD-endopeptidase MepM/ murein hydrolase activator NlpD
MKRQEQLVASGGVVGDLLTRAKDAGLDLAPETTGAFGKTPTPKPDAKPAGAFRASSKSPDKRPGARIAAVASEIDTVTSAQVAALEALARDANTRSAGIRKVATKLGLPIDAAIEAVPRKTEAAKAVGGPFETLPAGPFRDRLISADLALTQFLRVRAGVDRLPIRRPTGTQNAITSEFGPRRDPFLGVMAMHTGIDFRGDNGDPIRATAAGRVVKAGREGGYGLMVELDHGTGLTTRFAHMSRIRVEVGDTVKAGEIVGDVGSTGRSTGPHLHYETRVNGDAVNPMSYLSAGRQLREFME